MGTAGASLKTGDPNESRALKRLLTLVKKEGFDKKKKAALDQLFSDVITEAIFGRQADANTKRRVAEAVQTPVMDNIIRKYMDWEREVKKAKKNRLKEARSDSLRKWPFPKNPSRRRRRSSTRFL